MEIAFGACVLSYGKSHLGFERLTQKLLNYNLWNLKFKLRIRLAILQNFFSPIGEREVSKKFGSTSQRRFPYIGWVLYDLYFLEIKIRVFEAAFTVVTKRWSWDSVKIQLVYFVEMMKNKPNVVIIFKQGEKIMGKSYYQRDATRGRCHTLWSARTLVSPTLFRHTVREALNSYNGRRGIHV